MRNENSISLIAGCIILFSLCFVYLITAVTFMFNQPVTQFHFPAGILIAFLVVSILFNNTIQIVAGTLVAVAAFFLSYFIATHTIDISWDGLWYHQNAIIATVKEGVNFYHTKFPEGETGLYVNHYPPAAWITGSAIFCFFGDIEIGKIVHPLWIISAAFLAWNYFRNVLQVSIAYSFLAGILISFNPIALNQYNSFYIDGQIASQLTCFILLGLSYHSTGRSLFLIAGFPLVILMFNMKFTVTAYIVIFIVAVSTILLFSLNWTRFRKYLLVHTFSLCIGAFIFGFQPYVNNFLHHEHVFYPLAGIHKIDMMTGQYHYPKHLIGKSNLEKYVTGFISFTRHTEQHYASKGPLVFKENEYYATSGIQWLIGGMGPLFSGIMSLSVFIFIVSRFLIDEKKLWNFCFLLSLFILISVIINPENWSARYVPQQWLIPFLLILPSFAVSTLFIQLLRLFVFVAMLINSGMFLTTSIVFNQQRDFRVIQNNLKEGYQQYPEAIMYAGYFDRSMHEWFKREGIKTWDISSDNFHEQCENPLHIMKNIYVCPK